MPTPGSPPAHAWAHRPPTPPPLHAPAPPAAPRIEGIRVDKKLKDEVLIEVDFRWAGDANIHLGIEMPAGGSATRMVPKVSDLAVRCAHVCVRVGRACVRACVRARAYGSAHGTLHPSLRACPAPPLPPRPPTSPTHTPTHTPHPHTNTPPAHTRSGTARIILKPLLPEIPGFGAAVVSVMKPPIVRFNLDFGSAFGGSYSAAAVQVRVCVGGRVVWCMSVLRTCAACVCCVSVLRACVCAAYACCVSVLRACVCAACAVAEHARMAGCARGARPPPRTLTYPHARALALAQAQGRADG